jgi:uncharacterized SAM-binding protein YcdF (DUF218 family)
MTTLVFHIARPITLWALHFIAVYALISAACAPRELLDTQVMRAAAALVTLAVSVLVLAWLVGGLRTLRRTEEQDPNHPLALAAAWCAAISLLAILANLWPVATLSSCTG